ncbi:DUF6932 family protein [Streptomyces sp. NPDC058667]|uniref:DUF6932 family protein n=1 Tax=Streptomyces sp. NPDC058667 TaxID=3346588 RepID=UPI003657FC99
MPSGSSRRARRLKLTRRHPVAGRRLVHKHRSTGGINLRELISERVPDQATNDYSRYRFVAGGAGGTVHGGHSLIPPLTPGGMLPVGRHPATLEEIHDVFVANAPNRSHRERLYSALELYAGLVQDLLPRATLWVDGGFCTYKTKPPKDIDLALVASSRLTRHFDEEEWRRMSQLLTLQHLSAQAPPTLASRVQPMGGLIDAFLVEEEDPADIALWDYNWSLVKDDDGKIIEGERKGYLEVAL